MTVDGVVLEVDGRDAEEVDVGACVVALLGVDVVPVGHAALRGVHDGRDAEVLQDADAHRRGAGEGGGGRD